MDGNLTEIILFYFFRLFCFGFLAFYYFCFRGAIDDRLIRQRKLSYVKLYELKKGIKNYWFFENIHKQVNLGFWYRFNFLYIILYALFLLPLKFLVWDFHNIQQAFLLRDNCVFLKISHYIKYSCLSFPRHFS